LQQPPGHHLAQLNIGRIRYDLDDPRMADFTNNLALINGIAERSAGFVWRYVDESGNATDTRPFDEPRIIVNFSVWDSVAALEHFVWIGTSMAAAPIGSSTSKDRPSRFGGCRSDIGRMSRRPSRAWTTSSNTAQATTRLIGRWRLLSSGRRRVVRPQIAWREVKLSPVNASASEAIQSLSEGLDCFGAHAPRNDGCDAHRSAFTSW